MLDQAMLDQSFLGGQDWPCAMLLVSLFWV